MMSSGLCETTPWVATFLSTRAAPHTAVTTRSGTSSRTLVPDDAPPLRVVRARLGDVPGALRLLGPAPSYARAEHTLFRARIAVIAGDTAAGRTLWKQSIAEVSPRLAWQHANAYREVVALDR